MKKILFLLFTSLLFSCSGDDPANEGKDQEKPGNEEPNIPEVKVDASISIADTIFNNKTISIGIETKNDFKKVEYYFDGELIGTSINEGYKINWTPKDIEGGKHEVQCVCFISEKEYKFNTSTVMKLLLGEEYAGGVIVFIEESGTKGLAVAKSDVSGGEMAGEFYWGSKGKLIGANSEDGKENTKKIIEAYSDNKYSIASILKKGINIAGYEDWYLPSENEFKYIEKNKEMVPNLKLDEKYWTSTEKDADNAHFGHFSGTMMGTGSRKDWFRPVRLIRSF